jgi:transcriptional regulator with XRE-family HTH domain
VRKSVHTVEQITLQNVLRKLRTDADLRQADLAERLGTNQQFVSRYESGEKMLDLGEIRQICHALGITLADLVVLFEEALK